jgi:two-component system response regulator LytT
MIRIAIVDDEKEVIATLQDYILRFLEENSRKCVFSSFTDAHGLVDDYVPKSYDLVFLDIAMPSMDGMTAARKIREKDKDVILIFVTSLAQYAISGYEVGAFDYILKPINYYAFQLKIRRVLDSLSDSSDRMLVVATKTSKSMISSSSILFVEVMKHKLIFHTTQGDFTTSGTLKSVEKDLEGLPFALCNQCYLVHIRYVTEVKDYSLSVGKYTLQISHPRKKDFMHALNTYLSNGGGNKNVRPD